MKHETEWEKNFLKPSIKFKVILTIILKFEGYVILK
jgi:hypothetical protein